MSCARCEQEFVKSDSCIFSSNGKTDDGGKYDGVQRMWKQIITLERCIGHKCIFCKKKMCCKCSADLYYADTKYFDYFYVNKDALLNETTNVLCCKKCFSKVS